MQKKIEVEKRISSWIAQEVLTPQPLPSPRDVEADGREYFQINHDNVPWDNEKNRLRKDEKAVYWILFIGKLDLKESISKLLIKINKGNEKKIKDDVIKKTSTYDDERLETVGYTTLAAVVLNEDGIPIEKRVFISSFAWGYGQVVNSNFQQLHLFSNHESSLKLLLETNLYTKVTFPKILSVIDLLSTRLLIPKGDVYKIGIAIRCPSRKKKPEPPELDMLNSFFLDDLYTIKSEIESFGMALKEYFGFFENKETIDINESRDYLREILSPQSIPFARWPNRERHSLVMHQQAAVIHCLSKLKEEGLVAINGPPGTGKTTLLRDLLAAVVIERATKLSSFKNPLDAFKKQSSIHGGAYQKDVFQIDEGLLGYEIVVASSNNRAVENISKEIPSIESISDHFEKPIRYFSLIADKVASRNAEIKKGVSWGLVAAVLGNMSNRSTFINNFWWDEKYSLQEYLKFIYDTSQVGKRLGALNELLNSEELPKNEHEAYLQWEKSKADFLDKKGKIEEVFIELGKSEQLICDLDKLNIKRREKLSEHSEVGIRLRESEDKKINAEKELKNAREDLNKNKELARSLVFIKPNVFIRILKNRIYREWRERYRVAVNNLSDSISKEKNCRNNYESELTYFENLQSHDKKLLFVINKLNECFEKKHTQLISIKELCGAQFPDNSFWNKSHEEFCMSTPWLSSKIQDIRDDLFKAAFDLHRSFIAVAALPLLNNISLFFEILKGKRLITIEDQDILSLWASFFLVVPLVSTTFASASRMFSSIGEKGIGWLFIDEAGQATPQAPIGSIWRSKRVVIVGDPLQIEPVVGIPEELVKTIFTSYDVKCQDWAAPFQSAQSIADRSTKIGTTFGKKPKGVWFGFPLLVHRRCEEPMFSISNQIAYNNKMVYATREMSSDVGAVLGKSCWYNIKGNPSRHWCDTEGQFALNLLKELTGAGINNPDVFFITPFRKIAMNFRKLLENDKEFFVNKIDNLNDFLKDRIGTIHTFQGKEAEAVFLVLGAQGRENLGARMWAGQTPNILNVAISRAKRRLYVIGNRNEWSEISFFNYLASSIPESSMEAGDVGLNL